MILPGMPRPMPMVGGGGLPPDTTWNPLDKNTAITLSNGNLTAANNLTSFRGVRATSIIIGKAYWEISLDNLWASLVGIGTLMASLTTDPGNTAEGWSWRHTGTVRNNVANIATIASYARFDVLGFAVDMINLKLHFSKNGVWQASSDPASGAGGFDIAASDWLPMATPADTTITANFNGPFTYPVPSGFN